MTIRLYDSAWVMVRDNEEPRQVLKDRSSPALFRVGGYNYDIDGRPFYVTEGSPEIVGMLNMQAARQLGLSTQYAAPTDLHI